MRIRAIAILSVLGLASTVWAQSLGEIAAQEKKRRKGATHVITEGDLARARGQNYSQPPETMPAEETSEDSAPVEGASTEKGEKSKTEEKTEAEIRAEKLSDWQARQKTARERVERLDKEVNDLELHANDMTVSQFGASRTRLIERLDAAKKELAEARQQLADLETERRRSGFSR
ncbi:MAG: hypothetical protein JXO72_11425 [Vicinamibacteria bacterium]|nr:hypothetical protein [Vicinamibacteria bacterium]